MPATVNHVFTSPIADGTDTQLVRPSDWNSSHLFSLSLVGSEVFGVFSNGGNVTFGLNTDGFITASAPGGGGGGLTNINVSAGTTSNNLSNFVLGNGNGITFGLDGSTITASHNGLTSQSVQPVAYSAANGSAAFSTLKLADSNGVSWSTGTQGLFATVKTDYLTTARASNDAIGLNTAFTAGPLAWTVNSSGLSLNAGSAAGTTSGFAGNLISGSMTHNTAGLNISLNHPNWLTTARASTDAIGLNSAFTAGPLAMTINSSGLSLNAASAAGTTSGFAGNSISGSMTHNTAGLNISLNHPNWLTTARASTDAIGLNTAFTAGPLALTINSSGLSLNAASAAGTTSGFAGNSISGSMTHNTAGLNISLNHPNWLTTARASNDAIGLNTAQSNVTWTVNSSGLSLDARGYAGTGTSATNASITLNSNGLAISVAAGGGGTTNQTGPNIADGNGNTITSGTVVFSNSNGVSFGLNGSTMTGSIAGGTATMWWPFNEGVNVVGQQGNGTWHVVAVPTPAPAALGEVQIDRLCFPILVSNSSNSTGSATVSVSFGLYTKNGSNLSLAHSTTGTLAVTYSGTVNNSTYAGIRLMTVPWTTTLGDGRYYAAVASRTTTGGTNCTVSQVLVSQMNSNFSGLFGANSNRSIQWPLGFGVYSASSTGFPNPIPLSQIDGTASLAARPPSWFMISGSA